MKLAFLRKKYLSSPQQRASKYISLVLQETALTTLCSGLYESNQRNPTPSALFPRMNLKGVDPIGKEGYTELLSSDDDAPSTGGSTFSVRDEEFYDAYENLYVCFI
jgi:hypothetical protein